MRLKLLSAFLAGLLMFCLVTPAQAGGVVATCNETSLRAALAGGGSVTFTCSGVISLADTLTITEGTLIDGSGQAVTITGSNSVQIFAVSEGVSLSLNELTIVDGSAEEEGGAIFNEGSIIITNSVFSGNSAAEMGGAVYNDGTLTISSSTFDTNSSDWGGAIFNGGTLEVSGSTFSDNDAANGGGIWNAGAATVSNSTFTGNSATNGGAVQNDGMYGYNTSFSSINNTVASNSASSGGGFWNNRGILTLYNTIVASNTGGNCSGTITDGGGNLSTDATCPAVVVGNPALGPLQDNGGSTHTMALGTGSPAVDAANNATCAASPVDNLDQRGYPRPIDGDTNGDPVCDIGAFEFGPPPTTTVITAIDPQPSTAGQPFTVDFSVTSPGGTPTGSVTVQVSGGSESCTGSLSGGVGSCDLTLSTPGEVTLVASYAGGFFLPSQDEAVHQVFGPSVTTITSIDPEPSMAGETFTVNFNVTSTAGTPAGSVTVQVSGGTESCTGDLTAGAGSCTLNLATPGAYTLVASFTGAYYHPSQGQANHAVKGDSVTSITSITPEPLVAGEPFTVDFQVTSTAGTPIGSVIVSVSGSSTTCSAVLGAGSGSCQLTLPAMGEYTLTASFSGADYLSSQDQAAISVFGNSSTTITAVNPQPSAPGEPFTVSFTVTSTAGTPAGSVTVRVNGSPETCSATLDSGAGSCTLTLDTPGDYTLAAEFTGAGFLTSSDSQAHSVVIPLQYIYLPVVWQE